MGTKKCVVLRWLRRKRWQHPAFRKAVPVYQHSIVYIICLYD